MSNPRDCNRELEHKKCIANGLFLGGVRSESLAGTDGEAWFPEQGAPGDIDSAFSLCHAVK